MSKELDQRLEFLSGTSKGLDQVRSMLARGDFPDPEERRYVERWLLREGKRRHKAYLRTAEGSAIRQADAAVWAMRVACLALLISLVALWKSW